MRQPPHVPPATPLPIDDVLERAVTALSERANLVLVAPPGAGKTTRIPPAVLDAGLAGESSVYVLEPRRLAARLAAQHVARERGEPVGDTIGYEVRFDRKLGQRTRVRFVTEGVLLRKLASDPLLSDAGVVIIDEFHERHLAGDLALALVRRLQLGSRPDLRIAVMSATLDPEPVARFLGNCPIVRSEGRAHPVAIEYTRDARARTDLPLQNRVSAALRRLCRDGLSGDVLVFLPGAADIRRTMQACADIARANQLTVLPLHGDLPARDQDRAIAKAATRKLIVATNVAETSVTIDGVVYVIDSGLARIARHSPWSGLKTLDVEPISRASAAQRAGRAGRTRPGRCIRLYHQHDHDMRPAFDTPEVVRADLADAALLLHASGVHDLSGFPWFEPPPAAAMRAADDLLARLGAIDERGAVTAVGRDMLRFPVHPRQARMLIEAAARGVSGQACTLVALLGERALRADRRVEFRGDSRPRQAAAEISGVSDVLEDMEALAALGAGPVRAHAARSAGLDPSVALAARRVEKRLRELTRARPARHDDKRGAQHDDKRDIERALLIVTLAGYPDRVARRRTPGEPDILLCGGGSATLARTSVVKNAEFLVAMDAQKRGSARTGGVRVHRASAIEPGWLMDLYIERITESDELVWNPAGQRVERVSQLIYDGLVIDETRDPAAAKAQPERAAELLAAAAISHGIDRLFERDQLASFCARMAFAARVTGDDGLLPPTGQDVEQAVRAICHGLSSFAELRRISLIDALMAHSSPHQRSLLARLAPTSVSLPGRRRVPVHYESDRPPWIASRIQDFFGLRTGPTVAGGDVPLVLQLLAPNQRAVQVTSDLAGFWTRHYPALRRQLMRRYPRHAWPEDPLVPTPRR